MKRSLLLMMTISFLYSGITLSGQNDSVPPASPLFVSLSVNYQTGIPQLIWEPGNSPDVAGYVVYSYRNDAGFAIDTLYDPLATSYFHYGSSAASRIESYVVAAFDTSGNTSLLSNDLNTIFTEATIDTCTGRISISWNSYPSYPRPVTGYSVFFSVDNGSFEEAGSTEPDTLSLVIDDFITSSEYCFYVRASLEGGSASYSNKSCVSTRMQRTPQWINADYATVNSSGGIDLSFTVDPVSEIESFRLEKKSFSDTDFRQIALLTALNGSISYTDSQADVTQTNYYRLSAVNNCNNPLLTSNLCSNIVLNLQRPESDILLSWTSYRAWAGTISHYTLLVNTGSGFVEKAVIQPSDTSVTIPYSDLMYEATSPEICFIVSASESDNPWTAGGTSRSNIACSEVIENITVPNLFTPDGDNVNDLFRPVLSFTPVSYHFIVSDRNGGSLFETRDHMESWDGISGGRAMPPGVYLWFLRTTTPSGKTFSKTGTITIYRSN